MITATATVKSVGASVHVYGTKSEIHCVIQGVGASLSLPNSDSIFFGLFLRKTGHFLRKTGPFQRTSPETQVTSPESSSDFSGKFK